MKKYILENRQGFITEDEGIFTHHFPDGSYQLCTRKTIGFLGGVEETLEMAEGLYPEEEMIAVEPEVIEVKEEMISVESEEKYKPTFLEKVMDIVDDGKLNQSNKRRSIKAKK